MYFDFLYTVTLTKFSVFKEFDFEFVTICFPQSCRILGSNYDKYVYSDSINIWYD